MSAKNGKKKWIIIVAVVIVVALVIAGLAFAGNNKKQDQSTNGTVELITKRTIANSVTANGTVEAANTENITGGSEKTKHRSGQ